MSAYFFTRDKNFTPTISQKRIVPFALMTAMSAIDAAI